MRSAAPQALGDVEGTGAEPVRASQLVVAKVFDELCKRMSRKAYSRQKRDVSRSLGTGIKSLDDALEGGLDCGRLLGVYSEAGAGAGELCRRLIVDSLFKYDGYTVAVIDTTGNFDILRLYALILGRLKSNPDVMPTLGSPTATLEDVAAKILDRVKMMRVFDFVGVKEGIVEIRESLENRAKVIPDAEEMNESVAAEQKPPDVEVPSIRRFVADSEDEEDDDEMLFESEALVTQPESAVNEPTPNIQDGLENTPQAQQLSKGDEQGTQTTVKFILIDNLAQVVNPLLKKEYVQTNALVTEFLHDLAHLTQTHALHTILMNPANPPRSTSPTKPLPRAPSHHSGPNKQYQPPPAIPSPSIFASVTVVPSLMSLLAPYVDLGLLITRIPKKKRDAKVYYGDGGEGQRDSIGGGKRRVEMVSVLEVMSDRWGGRVGAWGTFAGGEDGIGKVV